MRLQQEPNLPSNPDTLIWKLTQILRDIAKQVNNLSEGYVGAVTNASTAAPTTGTYQQGDFIRNSAPAEAGSAGSKYVVTGWICSASGTPGTWLQCRSLTGN